MMLPLGGLSEQSSGLRHFQIVDLFNLLLHRFKIGG